jgi:hypothetical protein
MWFLHLRNLGQVSVSSVLAASLAGIAITAIMLWALRRLLRSSDVAAVIVAIMIAAFYAYGPLHDAVERISIQPTAAQFIRASAILLAPHANLSLVFLLVCVGLAWLIVRRMSRDSTRLTSACNVAAATLCTFLVARIATGAWQQHSPVLVQDAGEVKVGRTTSVLGYNPDIYYIILDGYARADILKKYYGFDNSPFIGELERRGFSVNTNSLTNYYWTSVSLPSSLNYGYLQDIAAPLLADPVTKSGTNGLGALAQLSRDNRAARFLRHRGYRFVHFQSSSPETVRNPFADEEVKCAGRVFDDEYFRALAESSWLQALGSLARTDLAQCHQLRLEALGDQAGRPGPKFVFAHLLPPHHPYLFDRDGNILKHVTISNQFDYQARLWEKKSGYLEQLRYVNRTMIEVIDRIRADSERPPIIILQSDHGPNLREGLTPEEVQSIRLANFAAYLLPGAAANVIPGDCSPVNQFRYLFNHYFEAGLPILPHKSYLSGFRSPLDLREIESVQSAQELQ